MKVYQENQETVNTGIKSINYEYLQEKLETGFCSFQCRWV